MRVAVGFGVAEAGTEVGVGRDIEAVGKPSGFEELEQEVIAKEVINTTKERQKDRVPDFEEGG